MSVFDLPMTARPGKDAIAGQDELGRTVYRTVTGERYTMPERTEMPAPTMGQRFENLGGLASRAYENLSVQGAIDAAKGIGEGIVSGIVQGFTAPGRALSGEPVSYGDVLATAGMAQVGAAPMRAPAGSLRSGAMGGGRPPVTFDDVARAMDEGTPAPGSVRTQKIGDTTVQFSVAGDGTAEIYSVRTPNAKRGSGSAREAMETILPQLRDEGATSVKLVSSPLDAKTNPAKLKSFYESLGFRGTGETANIAGDPVMRLDLAPPAPSGAGNFNVARQDASNIFGAGSERVRYTDPESGGTIEVVARPDGSASVLELEVPESSRGQGIGQKLQERVMQDFPEMGGQVSSKAAAKTAYRLGRRPPGKPDATLEEVFADIDEMSSVNMVSPAMQKKFTVGPK